LAGCAFGLENNFQRPEVLISHFLVSWALPPHMDRACGIASNFWKSYLIRTEFTLGERVSLMKVLRLFRLECIFSVFRVWTL
jgi:hypothetical protein